MEIEKKTLKAKIEQLEGEIYKLKRENVFKLILYVIG